MPAKIYVTYGPMNSSKSATLIMNAFNYREEGQNPIIFKPSLDDRDGKEAIIKCRPGLTAACELFDTKTDLFLLAAKLAGVSEKEIERLKNSGYQEQSLNYRHKYLVEFGSGLKRNVDCILIDEVQFTTVEQAKQLLDIADYLNIPVLAFGLRNDFKGNGFPAMDILLNQAEVVKENKGICWCGKKSTHVLRLDSDGNVDTEGEQIKVGGGDTYKSVCRFHHRAGQYKAK